MEEKEHIIPLAGLETQPQKGKRIWVRVLLVFGTLIAFALSPLPFHLLSMLPESLLRTITSDLYQDVVLDDNPKPLTSPLKYALPEPLPVLSRNTHACFFFRSTTQAQDRNLVDTERRSNAEHQKGLAKIIAIGNDGLEYQLDNITFEEGRDNTYTICQGFKLTESSVPKSVTAIFIRPDKPFQPSKVMWTTVVEVR